MKMERIESSETSALKAQTPRDYPKNTIRQEISFSPKPYRTTLGVHLASYPIGTEVKQMGCAGCHSSLSTVEGKNEWSCTSAPFIYIFMTWTGAIFTVVKKYGGTREYVLWTARHQLINSKTWIQQQGSRVESLVEKEISLLQY